MAVLGELNRQQLYGGDVISRIVYCNEQSVAPLSELIRAQLGDMLRALCAQAGADERALRQLVITGNTTMLYILFAIEPGPLAVAPFYMEQGFGGAFDARIPGFAGVPCFVPGCASAYIGADITCSVLASGIANREGNFLLVDAGTNGEMVLSAGGRLRCCSTAAGPAFEGAGISCGGNASLGAVDSVRFENGAFSYTTIGGAPADKLCGSGLIDAVAALLDAGFVNGAGKLKTPGGGDFYLDGSEVYVSQKDVRQLQLAKAAIRGGMDTLIPRERPFLRGHGRHRALRRLRQLSAPRQRRAHRPHPARLCRQGRGHRQRGGQRRGTDPAIGAQAGRGGAHRRAHGDGGAGQQPPISASATSRAMRF